MKERPILFSGAMVRAILDGTKTQTRRIVKPQPEGTEFMACGWYFPLLVDTKGIEYPGDEVFGLSSVSGSYAVKCPYGKPGERLWVRETWYPNDPTPWYRADFIQRYQAWERDTPAGILRLEDAWKPSIHMPRAASRITLEIVSVRVERLQEISETDAMAEGIKRFVPPFERVSDEWPRDGNGWLRPTYDAEERPKTYQCPVTAYRKLWESINGPGSWEANPWVWVVEFKKVEAGS